MPTYKIGVSRTYLITIQAEDAQSAKALAGNYLYESDRSKHVEREENKFAVDKIELLESDVFECDND